MAVWGMIKKMMAEALPFVARSPEMQVRWLVAEFHKGRLSEGEIAPYMHLLLSGYHGSKDFVEDKGKLPALVSSLPREILVWMIRCTEIDDIPELLELVRELTVDDAVLVLRKEPPPYEKKSLFLLDRVFQAVNGCGEHLLERAGAKMVREGNAPAHFASAYARFQEILIDEKILASLYPQARG